MSDPIQHMIDRLKNYTTGLERLVDKIMEANPNSTITKKARLAYLTRIAMQKSDNMELVHLCLQHGVQFPITDITIQHTKNNMEMWQNQMKRWVFMLEMENKYLPAVHISEIPESNRTASYLATAVLYDDDYHNNIQRNAREMVAQDNGDFIYRSSYADGSTSWSLPNNSDGVVIGN